MKYTPEQMARIVHEMIRAVQYVDGDPVPTEPWDACGPDLKYIVIRGVDRALAGVAPSAHHEAWMADKAAQGWRYGEMKSYVDRTHPNMIPYWDLPRSVRFRDELFIIAVTALAQAS